MATDIFDSQGKKISIEIFQPSGAGQHPAIIIAYGTAGLNAPWGDGIRSFARDLAEKGYVALIPDYFERTNTIAGLIAPLEAFPASRDLWLETLGDALSYATGRSDIDSSRMGLVGFSMGAHLALRTAKKQCCPKSQSGGGFLWAYHNAPFQRHRS